MIAPRRPALLSAGDPPRRPIVIDPGHGGTEMAGASTPFGCWGRGPLAEKAIALDIARRVRARAPERVLLTRDGDHNLSLGDRIGVGRQVDAATFLSIHTGGAADDQDAWVHARASAASRRLGACVAAQLAAVAGTPAGPLRAGPLAVLEPDHHAPDIAACLIELGRFGDPQPDARLADPLHRQRLADAISRAVLAQAPADWPPPMLADGPADNDSAERARWTDFDIWHEVPLVQQLTGMSCWAAAAAMIVGWRDCIDIDSDEVARGAGRWQSYRDGLEPGDVEGFARAWGLEVAHPQALSVVEIRRLLEEYGPIWVGEASPGLHVVVVAGMYGDGSPDGTFVRIADPWPIGRGERYTLSFREFQANLRAAAVLAGGLPQILHASAGGRGASRRSSSTVQVEHRVSARRGIV